MKSFTHTSSPILDFQKSRFVSSPLVVWAITLVALGITIVAWHISSSWVERAAEERFNARVDDVTTAIRRRMVEYEQVLKSSAALFAVSDTVTRSDWKTYVDRLELEKYYPGIQGIGFTIRVDSIGKRHLEEQIRSEGYKDFKIFPDYSRPEYHSIIFLEPFTARNFRAFGFDMFSEPVRRKAMASAMRTGEAALSGVVTLLQETDQDVQKGFLLYLPLYKKNAPLLTVSDRERNLVGFVYSPFRINDLMRGIFGPESSSVDVTIVDTSSPDSAEFLYSSDINQEHKSQFRLVGKKTLLVAGRKWTVTIKPTDDLIPPAERRQPLMIGLGGLLANGLIFYILLSLSRANRRTIAASKTIKESEERFRFIADATPVFVWMVDPEGKLIYFNKTMKEFVGYIDDEIEEKGWGILIHPDDLAMVQEGFYDAIRQRTPYNAEFRIRRQDGQFFWLLASGVPRYLPDGQFIGFVGSSFNIHDRKMAEEALKESARKSEALVKELSRKNRELEEFSFIVSHDLKSPLRAIGTLSDFTIMDDENLNPETKMNLQLIKERVMRMQKMIEGILRYSKLGTDELDKQRVNVNDLIDEVLKTLDNTGRVKVIVQPDMPEIYWDKIQLHQVFQNLIDNAIKYIDKPEGRVEVGCEERENALRFHVRDNGPGIEEQYHGRIFRMFQTLRPKDLYESTGIGLSIVQRVIHRMGGKIWVDSTPGKGTTFYFEIPKEEEQQAAQAI